MGQRAKKIEFIARGLCFDRSGRVLLCRNRPGNYFYLPGGHIEPGEAAAAALSREFLEECGAAVRVGSLLACEEHFFRQGSRLRHELNLVFHVEHRSIPEDLQSLEADLEFRWVARTSLRTIDLRPLSCLTLIRRGRSGVRWLSSLDVPRGTS